MRESFLEKIAFVLICIFCATNFWKASSWKCLDNPFQAESDEPEEKDVKEEEEEIPTVESVVVAPVTFVLFQFLVVVSISVSWLLSQIHLIH